MSQDDADHTGPGGTEDVDGKDAGDATQDAGQGDDGTTEDAAAKERAALTEEIKAELQADFDKTLQAETDRRVTAALAKREKAEADAREAAKRDALEKKGEYEKLATDLKAANATLTTDNETLKAQAESAKAIEAKLAKGVDSLKAGLKLAPHYAKLLGAMPVADQFDWLTEHGPELRKGGATNIGDVPGDDGDGTGKLTKAQIDAEAAISW